MAADHVEFTIGVEEEYQVVGAGSRELRPQARQIVPTVQRAVGDQAQPELYQSQVEVGTPVCQTLAEVRRELSRLRAEAIRAAEAHQCQVAAAGTHPFSHWAEQEVTPKNRYRSITRDYQQLAREEIIFGNHVHVGIASREAAIQTMNRARIWLAPLVALAASSPFWLGADSGYASFGREMWRRWPLAGVPPYFSSRADYDRLVHELVDSETVKEPTKLYWDIRPSERFDTLEFRVTDVCTLLDEAVLIAGLVRARARTCYLDAEQETSVPEVRQELLVASNWRAARYGMAGNLLDLRSLRPVPARQVLGNLLEFVRPALEKMGDWEETSTLLEEAIARGTGAARQREAFRRGGNLESVVDQVVSETRVGTS